MPAPATAALHAMLQYRLVSLCNERAHRRQLDRREWFAAFAFRRVSFRVGFFSSPDVWAPFFPRAVGRALRNATRAPLMTYVWIARASNSAHTSRTRTTLW